MAIAKARMTTKTRQVTETYEERDGVVLTLTEEEAAFLTALLGGFVLGGGDLRLVSNNIWDALNDAGMRRSENPKTISASRKMSGSVMIDG